MTLSRNENLHDIVEEDHYYTLPLMRLRNNTQRQDREVAIEAVNDIMEEFELFDGFPIKEDIDGANIVRLQLKLSATYLKMKLNLFTFCKNRLSVIYSEGDRNLHGRADFLVLKTLNPKVE